MVPSNKHRCGTVAIIGRPNVGKSTLLNFLLGEKIAIVSPKPETTRRRLLGILTLPQAQILFLDTPGIYRGPITLLAKHQVQGAREALSEADVILFMTEARAGFTDEDRRIARFFPLKGKRPVFLAINKVDRVEKALVLPHIEQARQVFPFREIFPISAEKGTNVEPLLGSLVQALPEGLPIFPPDQITDRPLREQAQEIIREKALLFTHDEIPHSVGVLVEEWRHGKPRASHIAERESQIAEREAQNMIDEAPSNLQPATSTYIQATIFVERDSQKGILIGKQGALLKKIGQASRKELEEVTDGQVYLDLWVKVARNWRRDPIMLKRLGYPG